jgi:broad specificity phosphatase PhoE
VPEIRREVPAAEWRLSDAGTVRAAAFARQLDPGTAIKVYSSAEPKALETAHVLQTAWGLDGETIPGLGEHVRPLAQMFSREEFEARVRQMFLRPGELIFGDETADQARRRFTLAVMRLVTGSSNDVIVVSHGTVMTLFAAEAAGLEPFAFWKSLEMPCAVTLSIPDLAVIGRSFLK